MWLSVPFLYAQEGINEVSVDSSDVSRIAPVKKKKNIFARGYDLLVNYLDSYSYDTAYIRPSQYFYTIMVQQSATFEQYAIRSTGEKTQTLHFAPNHSYKLGAYFGWHSLFLGVSVNTDELFSDRHASNKKTEYYINLYGHKLGCDLFYRSTGNDFKIRGSKGFFNQGQQYNFKGHDFDGLKVKVMGMNLYYVFNNKHFSYPAAYSQTTVQKISRGTLVAGLSWSRHNFEFDYEKLPPELLQGMRDELKFTHIKYTDFSINFGYAFNWVFADNWLLAVALTPAIGYKISKIDAVNTRFDNRHNKFNVDFITRSGIVYNNNRFFIGASAVAHIYQYYQKNFMLIDNFGIVNIYMGLNFGKR